MAWVKLDDAMPHHPKVLAAGPQAFALDVAGICYSNKHGTDGLITRATLPAVLPSLPSPRKWAARLVEVGRWHEPGHECPDCPQPIDGWRIHDVHDYQPTSAKQQDISRKRSEAGKRGGTKSGAARRAKSKQVASPGVEANANPVPVPVPQGQDQPPSPSGRSPQPRGTRLPDGWKPADEPDLVAAVGGIEAARAEYRKFADYWRAKPGKDGRKLDWQATWRNWLRRAAEDRPPGVQQRHLGPVRPPEGEVDYQAGWHTGGAS